MSRLITPILGLVLFLSVAIWATAQVFAAASEREITYQYISDALSPDFARESLVRWEDPLVPLVRPFTPVDAEIIGLAMTEAWQVLAVAQASGRTDILRDNFTGVAFERALRSVDDATAHGGRITILSQVARPNFFHLDGSVFQAEVSLVVARYVEDDEGLVEFAISAETGVVTMMNETTGWRIFGYERRTAEPLSADGPGWQPERLLGVNYFPSETPWRQFWPEFEATRIAQDFDLVQALGGNAVRIFLTRDDFIDAETRDNSLRDLQALLDLALEHELRVIPTLFDLRGGYGPGSWAVDAEYLRRVLPVLAASEAVAMVDLKNEPDLDFEVHGRGEVEGWLRSMLAISRDYAPDLAITVGWSSAESALILGEALDAISYHEYAPIQGSRERLSAVQAGAGDKPVLVTEIGASSFDFAFGFPSSPQRQAETLSERFVELSDADGLFVWALRDFEEVDGTVVGASPWVLALQAEYGLFDIEGQEKPAASVVRDAFHLLR